MSSNNRIEYFKGEYRFLSNFWPCKVFYEGLEYPSVEHAYVAAKTTDESLRARIQMVSTAANVKRFGREIELREDWGKIKLHIMRILLNEKFSDKELYDKLLTTRGKELIEGNTWGDTYWGQCPIGNGSNHLGKLLMEIRDNCSLERFML